MGESLIGGQKKSIPSNVDDLKSVRSMSSVGGGNQNEDFKMFLEDVNDDLFDH